MRCAVDLLSELCYTDLIYPGLARRVLRKGGRSIAKNGKEPLFYGVLAGVLAASVLCVLVLGPSGGKGGSVDEVSRSSGAYVYAQLRAVGPSLREYLDSGDAACLEAARRSLAKLSAVCAAWGERYDYLAPEETVMSDVNAAWCVRFFIRAHDCLDEVLDRGAAAQEPEMIEELARIFAPDDGEAYVSFSSVFGAFAESSLSADGRFAVLIGYDTNRQPIPAEF